MNFNLKATGTTEKRRPPFFSLDVICLLNHTSLYKMSFLLNINYLLEFGFKKIDWRDTFIVLKKWRNFFGLSHRCCYICINKLVVLYLFKVVSILRFQANLQKYEFLFWHILGYIISIFQDPKKWQKVT